MSRHPIQPIEVDPHGTARFKENKIVRFLLDKGGIDLNQIAREDFPQDDRDQFTQLIGYSVSAAPLSDDTRGVVDALPTAAGDPRDAEIAFLRGKLSEVRRGMRIGVSALFGIHPDDLEAGSDDE